MEMKMKLEDLENVTLETLITRHRDRFDLRYSTDQDLHSLTCESGTQAGGKAIKNTLVQHVLTATTFASSQGGSFCLSLGSGCGARTRSVLQATDCIIGFFTGDYGAGD